MNNFGGLVGGGVEGVVGVGNEKPARKWVYYFKFSVILIDEPMEHVTLLPHQNITSSVSKLRTF